jgi:predicted transcriptional regulator of viral defense system
MGDIRTTASDARPDREGLYQLASGQRGYFTSAQARDYGYSRALLAYHTKAGTLQRAHTSVYRFRDYPSTPREEMFAAWLAVGKDVAVASHESALEIWNLSDLIPDAVHLSVPRSRRHLPRLPGVTIHTTTRPLGRGDVRSWDGIRVTAPARTLLDIAEDNISMDQVGLALAQAMSRGWIRPEVLRSEAARRGPRSVRLADEALASMPSRYRELE